MNLSPLIVWLARTLALLGGVVLVAMTLVTVVSIIGRAMISFGFGPVPGDYELIEAGAAFAVFAFLPWCQLMRGHATVDVFTSFLPAAANRSCEKGMRISAVQPESVTTEAAAQTGSQLASASPPRSRKELAPAPPPPAAPLRLPPLLSISSRRTPSGFTQNR